jgi:hypothetical protein
MESNLPSFGALLKLLRIMQTWRKKLVSSSALQFAATWLMVAMNIRLMMIWISRRAGALANKPSPRAPACQPAKGRQIFLGWFEYRLLTFLLLMQCRGL